MTKTVFIYALCEPGTRTVRYIGKATNPKQRLYAHISRAHTGGTHKNCWLNSLNGIIPNLVILKEIPASEWQEWERRYIAGARALGMNLANFTDGGEGTSGWNPSLEHRAKLSVALTGEKNPFFGKKHSPESLAKMSASHAGVKLCPEHRAKIGAALAGKKQKPFSAEHRAKLSASKLGVKLSPEHRAKLSAANTGRKHSPETCAKRNAALTGLKRSQESREKMRAACVGKKSPMLGKKHTPEARAKISAARAGKKRGPYREKSL